MAKGEQGVSVSPDTLRAKASEIQAIDEWLDAASGGSTAGKVAIRNSLSKDENVTKAVASMIAEVEKFLADQPAEVKAGVYFGLNKGLADSLGKDAEALVEQQYEANKSNAEQVTASEQEIAARREERKKLVDDFKALKGILEMFGLEDAIKDIEDPKVLRGAIPGQKRGPRKINLMRWFVDGAEVPEDQRSLSGVASVIGGDMTAKALRAALKEAGVNTADPDNFEITVAGKVVRGEKTEVAADSETEAAAA